MGECGRSNALPSSSIKRIASGHSSFHHLSLTKVITIATCVFDMELNHKQASSALFFSLTRIKVGFLARGLRQKVLESSHGDGFFSRISTRKIFDLQ